MPSLVIRAPNHLGDLVMALPALRAGGAADVQVVRGLEPIVRMAGVGGAVLPLDRGTRGFAAAAAAVRRGRYQRGVLLTPSLGSAAVFALGGVRERRGTRTDGRGALLTDAVPPDAFAHVHRASAYVALVAGDVPEPPPVPRLTPDAAAHAAWEQLVGELPAPLVGVFPGSNAESRRWDASRYAVVARALAERGASVVVFGGPGERDLTAEAAGSWALDLGGRTSLPAFAAGLARCQLLVTNDSGPMHLAGAVGTPVVALLGAGDPVTTRPLGEGHQVLRRPDLPCVPCVKNVCPRSGTGFFIDEAHRECLRLIAPADVTAAAVDALAEGRG